MLERACGLLERSAEKGYNRPRSWEFNGYEKF